MHIATEQIRLKRLTKEQKAIMKQRDEYQRTVERTIRVFTYDDGSAPSFANMCITLAGREAQAELERLGII